MMVAKVICGIKGIGGVTICMNHPSAAIEKSREGERSWRDRNRTCQTPTNPIHAKSMPMPS